MVLRSLVSWSVAAVAIGACSAPPPPFPQGAEHKPERPPDFVLTPAETAGPVASAPPEAPAPLPPMVELPSPEIETAASLVASDARYSGVADLVRAKQWKKARAALDVLVATEDAGARYDRFVAGKALSAWLSALDGDAKAARDGDAVVIAAWKDPAKALFRITEEAKGKTEFEKNRRLGLALNGVGQATFAGAEEARDAAAKIVFPSFKGIRSKDAVLDFIKTKVSPWLTKKREAIENAEKSYQKLTEIQPAPPPRWVIASAERVGTMWTEFADSFTKVPRPKEWDTSPEISAAYDAAVTSAAEPIVARAQSAYRACVGFSDKFRMEDDHSRVCRKNLRPSP